MQKPLDLKAAKKALDEALLDPKEREEREKKERRDADRVLNDLRTVLNIPEGRRLLWRILDKAHIFDSSFVPGMNDVTSYNEGQRELGWWLWKEIDRARFDAFSQMRREYKIDILNEKTEE